MTPRFLPFAFGYDENRHEDQPPAPFESIASILEKPEWKKSKQGHAFLYVHDEKQNLFAAIPVEEHYEVNVRIRDRFGLLGVLGKEQAIELGFGLLEVEDTKRLLKLFFDDNYPALRSLYQVMKLA